MPVSVTALVCAYNEADVIAPVVGDLVRQGVHVYFIDHGSSDDTLAQIEPFVGRGVIGVERLPVRSKTADAGVAWADVLRRKQELACELESDWLIHHDADEFRESPWPKLTLVEAIEWVDGAGYNAIDFELLQFRPTHDEFRPGQDPRECFPYYEEAEAWDRPQVRAWRRTAAPPDLVSSGGHDVQFAGRRVFPIRFLLRHYPIRGRAHGERKISQERRGRFASSERELGWHQQYDDFDPSQLIRDPRELRRFDADEVRMNVLMNHRIIEELQGTPEARERLGSERDWLREAELRELDTSNREVERLGSELDARNLDAERLGNELDARNRDVERLGNELDARNRDVEQLGNELDARNRDVEQFGNELDSRNRDVERLGNELHDRNCDVDARNRELDRLRDDMDTNNRGVLSMRADLESAKEAAGKAITERNALRTEIELAARQHAETLERSELHLRELLQSRTWRWSAPLRAFAGIITRGGQ